MYGYIYMTTNQLNGKRYIGQKRSDKFLGTKYLGSGVYLNNAINKYGREHFTVEIIEECNSDEELDQREIYWIKFYDAVESNEFYNLQVGGTSGNKRGSHLSDVARAKIRKALNDPDNIRRRSISLSKALRGKKKSRHEVEARIKALTGQKRTEEQKKRISDAHKGYIMPDEQKAKISKAIGGEKNGCYNKICINNGHCNKFIYKEELESYEEDGWVKGLLRELHHTDETKDHLRNVHKGRKWVTNGEISKQVPSEEVEKYLNEGWKMGRIYNKRKE